MRNEKILDKLFIIARDVPPVSRSRVAAGIVRRNNILAIGTNSYSSSFLARKFAPDEHRVYTHAEIAAIINYLKAYGSEDLNKCTLFVCRAKIVGGIWTTGLAKPCKGCQKAIIEFGLKDVIWT